MEAKADINLYDHDRRTLLHLACADGYSDLAQYLVAKGAASGERDLYGFEPIKYAILRGHSQIIKDLRQSGARLSKESILDLEYKLCRSASEGDHMSVEALISAGLQQTVYPMLQAKSQQLHFVNILDIHPPNNAPATDARLAERRSIRELG